MQDVGILMMNLMNLSSPDKIGQSWGGSGCSDKIPTLAKFLFGCSPQGDQIKV